MRTSYGSPPAPPFPPAPALPGRPAATTPPTRPDPGARSEANRQRDAAIVRGYLEGNVTIRGLAARLGVSYGTAHRVLTANNVTKHSRGWRPAQTPPTSASTARAATGQT